MRIAKRGASVKQMAYARRVFGGKGKCKQEIALDCGYTPNVARSIKTHIENKPGFNSAMAQLAVDSNNLALAAMHEFKARGFEDFSNKDLIGALNAIGAAWTRFNTDTSRQRDPENPGKNRLRTVILQQIENQTIQSATPAEIIDVTPQQSGPVEEQQTSSQQPDMDF